jgi:hypothetical protein
LAWCVVLVRRVLPAHRVSSKDARVPGAYDVAPHSRSKAMFTASWADGRRRGRRLRTRRGCRFLPMLVASGQAFGCRASTARSDAKAAARWRWSASGSSANSSARVARWARPGWRAGRSAVGSAGGPLPGEPDQDGKGVPRTGSCTRSTSERCRRSVPGSRATRPRPGGNPQPQADVHRLHERAGAAGQPANEDGLVRHRVVWLDGHWSCSPTRPADTRPRRVRRSPLAGGLPEDGNRGRW